MVLGEISINQRNRHRSHPGLDRHVSWAGYKICNSLIYAYVDVVLLKEDVILREVFLMLTRSMDYCRRSIFQTIFNSESMLKVAIWTQYLFLPAVQVVFQLPVQRGVA